MTELTVHQRQTVDALLAPLLKYSLYWSPNESVSVSSDDLSISCKLYPNPVTHLLHVDGLSAAVRADIYSSQGVLLQSTVLNSASSSMDVASLPAGIYFLHLNEHGKTAVRRFFKQ